MTGAVGERLDGRFARLWAASTMSALGSGMAVVAAPLFVASRTDDPLTVSVAAAVAWLIFALLGGFLFVLAAAVPFGVNAATYALSAVLVGLVAGRYRGTPDAAGGGRRAVRAEIAEGFR